MISDVTELSFLSEIDEIIKSAAGVIGEKDDSDQGPPTTEGILSDEGKANCIECGSVVGEDDNHCRKCGARQVVNRKGPKPKKPKNQIPKDEEDEEETGGKKVQDEQTLEMGKVAFQAVKKLVPEAHKGAYNAIFGTGVLGASGYGAVKLHQATSPKTADKRRAMRRHGIVRTASVKRRTCNPIHNIRKGKKRFRILEALVKSRG